MKPLALLTRIYAQPRSWLRAIVYRNRLEDEMEAELACHLEKLTEELIRSGLPPDEARRRARISMGSLLTSKEQMRDSLGLGWWDALIGDLRYGVRILSKDPAFTAIAVISLALAIGANTTIFSVAKQLLYDRLAVPHAADLRLLAWTANKDTVVHSSWGNWNNSDGRVASSVFSYPVFQQLRAKNRVLGTLFAFKRAPVNATINGAAQRVYAEMVSGNYYAELGLRPVLGRIITAADNAKPEQGAVAVISYGVWARDFGRSPAVLGQTIRINNTPLTIVGVNPKGFTSAEDGQSASDIFVPLSMQPLIAPMPGTVPPLSSQDLWWVNIMGRTKPGMSDRAAQTALNTQLAAAVRATMPVKKGEDMPHMDLRDGSRGLFQERMTFGKPMAVLMAMVGLVLLLACANIANLMLARGTDRQREMSVRLALGAGRARILRQMLVESLMLACAGGAGGLLFGYLGRNTIPRMLDNDWQQTHLQVHFDWGVFAFTAAITIATGILFGLAPAIAAAHANIGHGLKTTALTATRRRKGISGRVLVAFQIALSTLLVIGAGLFVRTLAGLRAVDVGFRADHLLLVEIDPPRTQYPPGKDVALHQQLAAAFAAVPGVDAVTPAVLAYISSSYWNSDFLPEGRDEHAKNLAEYYNVVGNNFFATLGIPVIAGRSFSSSDTSTSLKVGVINRSLARKAFPNQNPLGKRFRVSVRSKDGSFQKVWIEIVGVCADTRYGDLRTEPPAQFFLPFVQQPEVGRMNYEIRTRMQADSLLPSLRHVVQQIAPDLPLSDVRTQQQQVDAAMQQERVFVTLTSGFGLLALALASVGIYGIMAYSVSQRTNEIGVRLAVGAQPWQVRALVLKESTLLTIAGITVGSVAALLLSQLVKSMLYGIRSDDPATIAGGILVLLAVVLAASWIPARRAAGLDPMEALRHE